MYYICTMWGHGHLEQKGQVCPEDPHSPNTILGLRTARAH